jgi:pimeloyl-ACP methyl ester carboxylesterase
VHLFDLPGFGEAPPPPEAWGTIEYADLVQQYILDKISGTVVLVGHSFGGRVSIRLAARRLSQIRDLVLLGVPGLPQPACRAREPGAGGSDAAANHVLAQADPWRPRRAMAHRTSIEGLPGRRALRPSPDQDGQMKT